MPVVTYKRPYVTHYYRDLSVRDDSWVSQGYSSTTGGAIRSAIYHIVTHEYVRALIYLREDALLVYSIVPNGTGWDVKMGRSDQISQHIKMHQQIRRAKL